jgi:hypothetical protein
METLEPDRAAMSTLLEIVREANAGDRTFDILVYAKSIEPFSLYETLVADIVGEWRK